MYKKIFIIALVIPCFSVQAGTFNCQSAVGKSSLVINALLQDLDKTYNHSGGGGITLIKQLSRDSYGVSISQEERVDEFHYQFKIDKNCKVHIIRKTESTKTPG